MSAPDRNEARIGYEVVIGALLAAALVAVFLFPYVVLPLVVLAGIAAAAGYRERRSVRVFLLGTGVVALAFVFSITPT